MPPTVNRGMKYLWSDAGRLYDKERMARQGKKRKRLRVERTLYLHRLMKMGDAPVTCHGPNY
jgi:hypothetical protein